MFVAFDGMADNLIAFKIGYFEKGSETEQFWEVGPEDREKSRPKGKSYALIGDDVDFSQDGKGVSKGKIASCGGYDVGVGSYELSFELSPLLRVILRWR